jgi:hypothetical protein
VLLKMRLAMMVGSLAWAAFIPPPQELATLSMIKLRWMRGQSWRE